MSILLVVLSSVLDGMRTLLLADASSGVEKHPSVHAEGLAGDEAGVRPASRNWLEGAFVIP